MLLSSLLCSSVGVSSCCLGCLSSCCLGFVVVIQSCLGVVQLLSRHCCLVVVFVELLFSLLCSVSVFQLLSSFVGFVYVVVQGWFVQLLVCLVVVQGVSSWRVVVVEGLFSCYLELSGCCLVIVQALFSCCLVVAWGLSSCCLGLLCSAGVFELLSSCFLVVVQGYVGQLFWGLPSCCLVVVQGACSCCLVVVLGFVQLSARVVMDQLLSSCCQGCLVVASIVGQLFWLLSRVCLSCCLEFVELLSSVVSNCCLVCRCLELVQRCCPVVLGFAQLLSSC